MKNWIVIVATFCSLWLTTTALAAYGDRIQVDSHGYIMFCPCMGRFGNQADHYLGTLAFAKALNRTLVLPPFIEYKRGHSKSIQVPFETYFKVDSVKRFHRVVTMEEFFAPSDILSNGVWPKKERISFCYSNRLSSFAAASKSSTGGVCNAKSGNPFGPFWDEFDVDFVKSETYGPNLHHDVHNSDDIATEWNAKYPADKWPVLAFAGAPASFPVQKDNLHLHKYLFQWNQRMSDKAEDFIQRTLPKGPFIGVHLRNGLDWIRACDIIHDTPRLFSSAQCVGYDNEAGNVTLEMCRPSYKTILKGIKAAVKATPLAKSVFVASDNDPMLTKLRKSLKELLEVHKLDNDDNPHMDLAILARADYFVGNCVSSFSAFVKRERDYLRKFPTSFFGFPARIDNIKNEL